MSVRGRDVFNKFKFLMVIPTKILKLFPLKIRKMLFEHYRTKKGVIGIGIRYILIKSIAKKCGDNVSIHPDCYIFSPENLILGNNVSIHPMCYIDADGTVEIGDDVSIAHSVTILSKSHNYLSHDIPIKDQGCIREKVIINNNVWIGCKVTIMCGRTIGTGVVIGANSVVTSDIQPEVVAVGSPARVIKER